MLAGHSAHILNILLIAPERRSNYLSGSRDHNLVTSNLSQVKIFHPEKKQLKLPFAHIPRVKNVGLCYFYSLCIDFPWFPLNMATNCEYKTKPGNGCCVLNWDFEVGE